MYVCVYRKWDPVFKFGLKVFWSSNSPQMNQHPPAAPSIGCPAPTSAPSIGCPAPTSAPSIGWCPLLLSCDGWTSTELIIVSFQVWQKMILFFKCWNFRKLLRSFFCWIFLNYFLLKPKIYLSALLMGLACLIVQLTRENCVFF